MRKVIGMKRIFAMLVLVAAGATAFAQSAPDWYVGKKIKDIRFDGTVVVTSKELDPVIKEFKGKAFTDELWMSLLARVYELDLFEVVEPEAIPADAAQSAVIILFKVKEKPAVGSIIVVGNAGIRTQEILDSLTVKEATIFNDSRMRLDEIALRRLFQTKGFPDVKVSAESTPRKDGSIAITFTVVEGIQNLVEKIQFEGVESVSLTTLKAELTIKEKGLFQAGQFNETQLEESRNAVELFYKKRGFIDASVVDVRRESTESSKDNSTRLTLTFIVKEGLRYTFGGMSFDGNNLYSSEELGALVKLKVGAVLDYQRLVQDQSRIADLYFENGYIFNSFKLLENRDEEAGSIAYVMQIEEKPQAFIEDIYFKGNTKTQEFVLRRLVSLAPGDVFSKTKVLESLRNLYNTQYFSSIVPEYEQGSKDLFVDLIVSVEEQSTASIQFGLTYTPSASFPIIGLVNWSDINFMGKGQTLALKTNLAVDSQDLTFSFSDEWLFGKRLSGAVDFSFEHESLQASQDSSGVLFDVNDPARVPDPYSSYEEYLAAGKVIPDAYLMDYHTWTFSLGYSSGYRFSSRFGTIGFVPGIVHELGRTTYDPALHTPYEASISENLNTWLFSNSIYGRAYINDLDLWYDPSRGYYASQRLTLTGWFDQEVGDHFVRSDTRLDGFVTLFDFPILESWSLKAVLGAHTKFSALLKQPWAESIEVSASKKLAIDGTFVGRGWNTLASYTGTALWDNWLELRVPVVPGVLSLDGFLSAALVSTETGLLDLSSGSAAVAAGTTLADMTLGNFAYSTGIGLRFIILQFPFRIYFAKKFVFDEPDGFKFTNEDWQFVLSVTTNLD